MRTVAIITTSRADYEIYRPLLRRIRARHDMRLQLLVGGTHLAPEFGMTVDRIVADGFEPDTRVKIPLEGDTPLDIANAMSVTMREFGAIYAARRPDIIVALGDRFEMHAAVMAAVPFVIPIAHIAGGVTSAGAIDEVFRHGITKAAHIHFTETEEYARRLIRMGEHPSLVHVTGALALDGFLSDPAPDRATLEQKYGGPWHKPPILITFHPVTLEHAETGQYIEELLAALAGFDHPLIFTAPNADTGGKIIVRRVNEFIANRPNAVYTQSLGADYAGMLAVAGAMLGNSSSGLVEAPSFKLPVVNIGRRQQGRLAPDNVIHAPAFQREEIAVALQRALSPEFRHGLADLINPYGDGHAGEKIIRVLASQVLNKTLLRKEFYDVE